MKSAPVYILFYLLVMIPTYLMPLLGSNSTAFLALSAGFNAWLQNPMFLVHIGALLLLIGLAYSRGKATGRSWLVVFPVIALVFDFVPVLSSIPFVVTAMHLCALIIGATGTQEQPASTQ